MEYYNKSFLIVGDGISGKGVIEFLRKKASKIFLYSLSDNFYESVTRVKKVDKKLKVDYAIISAGFSLTDKIYKQFKKLGIPVFSELEFFGVLLTGRQIAVTGTNGKTTTTRMIGAMLRAGEEKAVEIGNCGKSIALELEDNREDKTYVIETSSFMLEKIVTYKPNIAIFLNFASDHLNHHKTLEEYFKAKCKIFDNQMNDDYAVLNFDDAQVLQAEKLVKGKTIMFSLKNEIDGAYIADNQFCYKDEKICQVSTLKLKGDHNKANVLAAICVAKICNVSNENITSAIAEFKPDTHRLETVKSKNPIKFIDSSKATNIASALADINAINANKTVILGGSDKKEDFNLLFKNELKKVSVIVCYGQTANKLYKLSKKYTFANCFKAKKFEEAIKIAVCNTKSGDTVLLSPACASFDQFDNYEARGEKFQEIVRRLS